MADDEKVKVVIEGDASDATEAIGSVGESLEGLHSALSTAFEITGIAAAVEAVRKLNDQLSEAAERANQMRVSSSSLGITTTQFQGLEVMAGAAGVGVDQLSRTMATLQSRMAQAGEQGGEAAAKFNALGITTQELRDPAFSVVDAMQQMGAASNSNAAIMAELGGRGRALLPILRELAENHNAAGEAAQRVGALTQGEIGALAGYHVAVDEAGMAWDNWKTRVLSGAIPAMEALAEQIREFATDSSSAVKGANMFQQAIMFVGEEVIAFIGQVKDIATAFAAVDRIGFQTFEGLAAAVRDSLGGNFKQAAQDIVGLGHDVSASWTAMFDSFDDNAKEAGDRFKALQAAVTAAPLQVPQPQQGNGNQNLLPDLSKSQAEWAAALEKAAAAKQKLIDDMLASDQKYVDEWVKSGQDGAKSLLDTQLGALQQQESAIQEAYKQHKINAQQELTETVAVLQQELVARMDYYRTLEGLAAGDQAQLAKIASEEAATQQKYLQQMQTAQNTYNQNIQRQWQSVTTALQNSLSSAVSKMLQGTETFGTAMRGIFTSVLDAIIQKLASWAAAWATQMLEGLVVAQTTSKAQTAANAGTAASGAMASVAAIPYVGAFMAPAVGAETYATAMGFMAEGGFDIPSGLSPVTQLHPKEMVLPAHLADSVRAMSGSGGGSRSFGGSTPIHLHATDAKSFERQVMNSSSAVAKGLRRHLSRGGR